uniref:GOLD domain-containing protein n=1 Tax=Parascaris equorum TaxID=6256 RepID=A0A914RF31_PAREQ
MLQVKPILREQEPQRRAPEGRGEIVEAAPIVEVREESRPKSFASRTGASLTVAELGQPAARPVVKNNEAFSGVMFVKNKYDTCRVEVSNSDSATLARRQADDASRDCGLQDMVRRPSSVSNIKAPMMVAFSNLLMHSGPEASLIQPRGKIELGNPVLMQMLSGQGVHQPVLQMPDSGRFAEVDTRPNRGPVLIGQNRTSTGISFRFIEHEVNIFQAICLLGGEKKQSWGRKKRSDNSVTEYETKRYKVPRHAQATTSLVVIDPLQQIGEATALARSQTFDFTREDPSLSTISPPGQLCMAKLTLLSVFGLLFALTAIQAAVVAQYVFRRLFNTPKSAY